MAPDADETKTGDGDGAMLRRVQRTGGSSLAVTLPKSWTDANSVRSGNRLLFEDIGGGTLKASIWRTPGVATGGQKALQVDASGASINLLCRLMVGAYVTGHDRVVLTHVDAAVREMLVDFDCTIKHLLGATLVSDLPDQVEIQIFVDPSRHRLPALLQRTTQLIRVALAGLTQALKDGDPQGLASILPVEDEIDRLYFLIVRQILLASDDFGIAKSIGVPSHHLQFGYRMVAKMLEVVGDLLHSVGKDLEVLLDVKGRIPHETLDDLAGLLSGFDALTAASLSAFTEGSTLEASEAIDQADRMIQETSDLVERMVRRVRRRDSILRLQRVVRSMVTAMEMMKIVDEIVINRGVEPEVVAQNGNQPLLESPRSSHRA